ncbi:MAG: hypothetical protein DRP02_14225 [Candidatus Gerdarchaeota archaeon]|nr:MAG: hypothetical protein DRP02_14225 [Candidatus Gerdarchaeota archaeon]
MRVVVMITPNGIHAYDRKLDKAETLAVFPEDIPIVAKAMHKAYAPMIDTEVLEEALYKLIEYLKRQGAWLYEGDLVRIKDGKLYGLKTLPEVAEDLQGIFGPEAEVLLNIFLRIANDLKERGLD